MKPFPPARLTCKGSATAISILLLFISFCGQVAESSTLQLEFDHGSGFYEFAFRLNLSTTVQDATIYYTTNAAVPHPVSGLRYDGSIPVSTTTIVRAAAFQGSTAVSDVETRTYLFASAVFTQNGDNLPGIWGTNSGSLIPAHYAMSPSKEESRQKILSGLTAIPTVSIATESQNLFSTASGVYLHPMKRGDDWERPASLEMFGLRGQGGFRIHCGLRIHGGMTRRPEESPKHSFRLLFKRRYGAAKLNFPVFGAEQNTQFEELILRAGGSDSWLDSNGDRRRRATYVRDEWMRQSMAAIGYPSARGRFVHVYLNGLYWGVYDLCERPGSSLLSPNQGTSNYDVRNAGETESGNSVVWDKVMTLANSGLSDPARYQAISQYLDLSQLADYLILNFYAGNSDWDRSANWYAIRPRTADGKFQFFVWDAEQTFADVEATSLEPDDDESPIRLFHRLSENATFRTLFATRAQRLLYGDGPISPGPAAERFRKLSDSIAPALAVESARWGSYRATVHQFKTGPYETLSADEHWQREVNRITLDYIPKRRAALIEQFRERGLFQDPNGGFK